MEMNYFIVFFGIAILIGILSIFKDLFSFFYERIVSVVKKRQPIAKKHKAILNKYSAYYKLLNADHKRDFEKRVQRFMYSKRFIPRALPEINDDMRVLISATAIQLTFGLPEVYLSNFDKILVYPDAYYSIITKKYHLGEVNPRAGVIILSWKSFVDGYADLNDTYNVGIHEMAHAIHFENRIKNDEYNFLDFDVLKKLSRITTREMPKLQNGEPHFLRSYAGTNEYEFFAVSLEHFFEDPIGMKSAIPDLYETIKILINQDPIILYKLQA